MQRPRPKKLVDEDITEAERAYVRYDQAVDALVMRARNDAAFGRRLMAWAESLTETNCPWQSWHVGQRLLEFKLGIEESAKA